MKLLLAATIIVSGVFMTKNSYAGYSTTQASSTPPVVQSLHAENLGAPCPFREAAKRRAFDLRAKQQALLQSSDSFSVTK